MLNKFQTVHHRSSNNGFGDDHYLNHRCVSDLKIVEITINYRSSDKNVVIGHLIEIGIVVPQDKNVKIVNTVSSKINRSEELMDFVDFFLISST